MKIETIQIPTRAGQRKFNFIGIRMDPKLVALNLSIAEHDEGEIFWAVEAWESEWGLSWIIQCETGPFAINHTDARLTDD